MTGYLCQRGIVDGLFVPMGNFQRATVPAGTPSRWELLLGYFYQRGIVDEIFVPVGNCSRGITSGEFLTAYCASRSSNQLGIVDGVFVAGGNTVPGIYTGGERLTQNSRQLEIIDGVFQGLCLVFLLLMGYFYQR